MANNSVINKKSTDCADCVIETSQHLLNLILKPYEKEMFAEYPAALFI